MADDSPQSGLPPSPGERRVLWPVGLSARLLLATALVVVLANVLIVPALLAAGIVIAVVVVARRRGTSLRGTPRAPSAGAQP